MVRLRQISEFAKLLFASVDTPTVVDKNRLLVAASSFLDTAQGEGTAGLEIARRMAFRALDWAVFERPDDYDRLLRAIHLFRMHAELTNH